MNGWARDSSLAETQQIAFAAGVVTAEIPTGLGLPGFVTDVHSREFFLRMLFSALADTDHADTERHMNPAAAEGRGGTPALATLVARLDFSQRALTHPAFGWGED